MESSSPIDVLERTIQQLEEEVAQDVRYQVYQKRVQVDKHKAELLGTAAALRPHDPTSPTFQLDLQLYQAAVGSVKDQVANFEASLWAANPQLYEAHLKLQQLQALRDQLDLLQKPDVSAASSHANLRSPSMTPSSVSMHSSLFSTHLPQRSAMSSIVQRSSHAFLGGVPGYQTSFTTPAGRNPIALSPTSSMDPSAHAHALSMYMGSSLPASPHVASPHAGSQASDTPTAQHHDSPGVPTDLASLHNHMVSLLTNPAAPRPSPRPPPRIPGMPNHSSLSPHQPHMSNNPLASGPSILPTIQSTDPLAALSAAAAGAAAAIAGNLHSSPPAAQAPSYATSLSVSMDSASTSAQTAQVPRVPNPGVQKPPLAHVLLKELTSGGFSFTTPHGTVVLDADDVELAKQLAGCEISDESYDARPLQLLVPKDKSKEADDTEVVKRQLSKLVAKEEGTGMLIQLPDGRNLKVSKDTYQLYQQLSSSTLAELARLVTGPTSNLEPATPSTVSVPSSASGPSTVSATHSSTSTPKAFPHLPISAPLAHTSSAGPASEPATSAPSDSPLPSTRSLPPMGPTASPIKVGAPTTTEEWVAASRDMVSDRTRSEEANGQAALRRVSSTANSESSSVKSGGRGSETSGDEDDGRDWRLFQKVVTAEGVTVCEVSGTWPNQKFRWRTLKEMPEKPKKSGWFKRSKSNSKSDTTSDDGRSRASSKY